VTKSWQGILHLASQRRLSLGLHALADHHDERHRDGQPTADQGAHGRPMALEELWRRGTTRCRAGSHGQMAATAHHVVDEISTGGAVAAVRLLRSATSRMLSRSPAAPAPARSASRAAAASSAACGERSTARLGRVGRRSQIERIQLPGALSANTCAGSPVTSS
jgi:hypothetical protein